MKNWMRKQILPSIFIRGAILELFIAKCIAVKESPQYFALDACQFVRLKVIAI